MFLQTLQANHTLILKPANWNPPNASNHLQFSWTCVNNKIGTNETVQVKQSLQVSSSIGRISSFSFDTIFEQGVYFPWDLNQDGVVDVRDLFILAKAFGSTPQTPNWDPRADLNADSIIDIKDKYIVALHYGEKYT